MPESASKAVPVISTVFGDIELALAGDVASATGNSESATPTAKPVLGLSAEVETLPALS